MMGPDVERLEDLVEHFPMLCGDNVHHPKV
jgi:hypothetical protein